jgi:hypothetical protein
MNCYEFWKFKGISRIFKQIKVFGKRENLETVMGRFWPMASARPGPQELSARSTRQAAAAGPA